MEIRIFSCFLAELAESASEPPEPWVRGVMAALRSALVAELRRRGLWTSSPRCLGVEGASRFPAGLDELVVDAYSFVFVERLSALRAQRRVRANVDGVVLCSLRHFLHERQQDNDRLGYLVYDAVRNALAVMLEAGQLSVVEGDLALRNDTVLAFPCAADGEPVEAEQVAEVARRWCDELLPQLVTAHGRGRVEVAERLAHLLADLPRLGVTVFRLRHLLEPLKSELRRRWAATLELEGGSEVGTRPGERWLFPFAHQAGGTGRVEQREGFRKLVDCVSRKVEEVAAGDPLRRELEQLWGVLRTWAGDAARDDKAPSQRGLAALLGISREHVGELLARLRAFVEFCQGLLAGRVAELTPRRAPA